MIPGIIIFVLGILLFLGIIYLIKRITITCILGFYPALWYYEKGILFHNDKKEKDCKIDTDYIITEKLNLTGKWYKYLMEL